MLLWHSLQILGEGSQLSGRQHGTFHSKQVGNVLLVYVVGTDTLFQVRGEFVVKFLVFVGVVGGLLFQELDDSLGQDVADSLDESAVLQVFTAEVKRDIFLRSELGYARVLDKKTKGPVLALQEHSREVRPTNKQTNQRPEVV